MSTHFYIRGKEGDFQLTFPPNSLLTKLDELVPEKDVDLRLNFKGTHVDIRKRNADVWTSLIKGNKRLETTQLSDKIDTLFRRLFYQLHEEDKKYGAYRSVTRIQPFHESRMQVLQADHDLKEFWLQNSEESRGLSTLQKVFISVWAFVKELFYFIKCSWHALLLNY